MCYKVITSHISTDTRALVCFIPDYFHSTPNCVHLSWSFEAGFAPGITDGEIIHTRPPAFSHSVALFLMESYYQVLRALSKVARFLRKQRFNKTQYLKAATVLTLILMLLSAL